MKSTTFSLMMKKERKRKEKRKLSLVAAHKLLCVKLGVVSPKIPPRGKERDRTWQTFSLVPRETFF